MTHQQILKSLRKDLKKSINLQYKQGCQNFFVEKIKVYGVPIPEVRKIARTYFPLVNKMKKADLLALSEALLRSNYNEEATVAIQYLSLSLDKLRKNDFKILELFLKKYINNWSKADDYCTHLLGPFLIHYPIFLPKLLQWTKSDNCWLRRAAAVSLISSERLNKNLPLASLARDNLSLVFKISEELLQDEDDLVQKGYGWLLKVSSRFFEEEVLAFVLRNKDKMPRTALRYAIEKMSPEKKKIAMKR